MLINLLQNDLNVKEDGQQEDSQVSSSIPLIFTCLVALD